MLASRLKDNSMSYDVFSPILYYANLAPASDDSKHDCGNKGNEGREVTCTRQQRGDRGEYLGAP